MLRFLPVLGENGAFARRLLLMAALALPAWMPGTAVAAKSETPAGPEQKNPSLLGTHWDFSKCTEKNWQHKNNARLTIVSEDENKALRLESSFKPFTFTWTTRPFEPRSAEDVAHITFRVRGDGSGHQLHVCLGAPDPNRKRSLYYQNVDQAIVLDFTGWRQISLDLDKFKTPGGGLRDRDLANLVFLQFMIHSAGDKPLDISIDDIAFTDFTEEEKVEMARRQAQREETVAEVTVSLAKVRETLAAIGKQLDALASQGKFVDVARVYLAALDWCADDIGRLLEAEEAELVEQAPALLADLRKRLADPKCVLGRVVDKVPEEPDRLDVERNPYVKSVVEVVRRQNTKQRFWAKGRKGFHSMPNAWWFSGRGNDVGTFVWTMTAPRSPLRHNPVLLANALSLLDTIAHQHTDGDFNIDRTAIYGRDPNINRFCLVPALDGYLELLRAYPNLLPPAKRADLEAGLKVLADYQVTDYGLARIAKKPHVKQPAYPNMDVHHILIMEFAHRLWGDEKYAKERNAFAKILDSAVYPNGAFTYINTQNECFVYHHLNVLYSARFWQLTKNPTTLAMLRKTIPFYPYNVEPAGMPEYYTDACWKHYWGGGAAPGPDTIAGLFEDPLNKRVAAVCANVWGYGHNYHSTIAAEFWKPIKSKPLPDGYVMFDPDIQGPRGRFGTWSFAGNGRNYGVGFQGKDTFVGCMITDPARRPLPMDSALQVVTTEVRLNHTDNHWRGGRCHAAVEKLTTTLGPDCGSLAVRYTVSKPSWGNEQDTLFPWEGTQQWYLSKSRLVGLIALESLADSSRAAVHGRIRLGVKRQIEQAGENCWKYGKLSIKIHDHNYARIITKPSETFYLDEPEKYRSTEITLLDPLSVKAGEKADVLFKKGERYFFLVEVFPEDSQPAEEITRLEDGSLAGFSFKEAGRLVVVLHNPSNKPLDVNRPLEVTAKATVTLYQDNSSKGKPLGTAAIKTRLEPHGHLMVIAEEK